MLGALDYHIHTKLCGHAVGEMEEYVLAARKAGLREMGFSDHIPMYFQEVVPGFAMTEADLECYAGEVYRLRKAYPELTVLLGLEADFAPGQESKLETILRKYEFDYILGSIHWIGNWGFDDERQIAGYEQWDLAELYRHYFGLVQAAARSGYFQIMAHPDLIKKLGFRSPESLAGLYEETARVFRDAGVCAELNTAGWRVQVKEIYPHPEFLEMCCHYKVPVTLGSDAHRPDLVGNRFNQAVALLKNIGFKQVATFRQRKMKLVPLDF